MDLSWCSSCCRNCFVCPPPTSKSTSLFALHNLLQAGTIILPVGVDVEHQICDHTHSEDNWHRFNAQTIFPFLTDTADIAFCRGLQYLTNEHFISATYHSNHDGLMTLRIYLIPYDLPNMQGKLRVRKENIMGPARRYLRMLLPKISQSPHKWNRSLQRDEDSALISDVKDSRTLADIYSDLASPQTNAISGYGEIASRLLDFEDNLEGLGMRSTLFKYQRQSVAAMLQKELDLRDVPDPLFIQLMTMDCKTFYLQPGKMEILQEAPLTVPCRGGILCEELGTGKTVMILSLIVATRTQISTPEPSIVDDRPILTPLAFRHFPSSEFATARQRLKVNYRNKILQQKSSCVPSLVELMLHRARTTPRCDIPMNTSSKRYMHDMEKEDAINDSILGNMIRANVPFYHQSPGEPHNRERAQRNKLPDMPRIIYLTSATLVIVPANLLSQWDRETTKHCNGPLRVLILRAKTPMPTVQSLATDYDIILMSYTRFSAEAKNSDISKLHTKRPCTCPEHSSFRIPNCTCQIEGVSSFIQIRWKRLVIDEGHVSSSLSSILVPFAKLLSVERRWIVTGTPTTNLLGLSLGSKASLDEPYEAHSTNIMEDEDDSRKDTDVFMDDIPNGRSLTPRCSPTTSRHSSEPQSAPARSRIWNKYDREDLNKLGNMITHFIRVPQFHADKKLMSSHIIEPLLDPSGPHPGAIKVLNQVMEMVMIRHKIEDVEQDVVLPGVTQEAVLLDLDPYVVKSFNALQASILINAVDSQRTDQDYMFHPRNAEFLQDTVKNMSQILFWHVDQDLYNAAQNVQETPHLIERAIKRNMPANDVSALRDALFHLRSALEDPLWVQMQQHEDVPYRVFDLQESIYQTWTRTPVNETAADPRQIGFMHADRLLKMNDMIEKRPLVGEKRIIELGEAVVNHDKALRKVYEEALAKKDKRRKRAKHYDESASASQLVNDFAKKASAVDTLREMQQELEMTMKRLKREELEFDDGSSSPSPAPLPGSPSKTIFASSQLAKMRIGSSASTKLNYIINEVQKYSKKEKFLIFSESPLSLAHVAEALELTHIKFLRFTTQVTPQIREQLVLTFETSETYRIFLMELKHGARGLNLISASRVIFCEPVWQADVESQAIKRAHRIGQTRPITVKTLAIRQTAEEKMVARRTDLKNCQEKLPKLLEEAGMRHYIANPKFITHKPVPTPINEFPLVDLPPELLKPRPGAIMLKIPVLPRTPTSLKRVRLEDPINEDGSPRIEAEEPSKKKKQFSLSFATP